MTSKTIASRAIHSTGAVDELCDKFETGVPDNKKLLDYLLDKSDQSQDKHQSVQGKSKSGWGKFKSESMGRDKGVALKKA